MTISKHITKILIIMGIFLFCNTPLSSHKFYTSITQAEYNEKTKSVEIICNVFWDDMEKALSNHFNKPVRMDDKDIDQKIKEYMSHTFYLKNSRKQIKKMELIGTELKTDLCTIYMEVAMPEELKKGSMLQSTLTELFDEQVNVVNLRYKGQQKSLVFKKNSPEQEFKF